MTSSITFSRHVREDGAVSVVPVVDGITLIQRVAMAGLEPSGEHDGLIPEFYRFGPLDLHYFGRGEPSRGNGRTVVLGCECGEWGCNPIFCQIKVEDDQVRWSDFCRFDGDENYRELGPFVFSLAQYRQALAALAAQSTD